VVDRIPVLPTDISSTVARGDEEDGLSIAIDLPRTTFLAGEAVSAHLVVRNDGPVPVFILDQPVLAVIDETGQPFRHQGFGPGDGPLTQPPPIPQSLDPGQSRTVSQAVQLPFEDDARQHTYEVQGYVQHAQQQLGNAAQWPSLETNAWPLPLAMPSPVQRLQATLQADARGWCLQATDGVGSQPAAPLSADMFAWESHDRGFVLPSGPGPVWAGAWDPSFVPVGPPIHVKAWVAGPGYVTAQLEETVPGP